MGVKATHQGGEGFEAVPPGSYGATVVGIYYLGTQPGYQGKPPEEQFLAEFALSKRKGPSLDADGNQRRASKIMGLKLGEKTNLCILAGAIRGKKFSVPEIDAIRDSGGLDIEGLLGGVLRVDIEATQKKDGSTGDKVANMVPLDPDDDFIPSLAPGMEKVYWDHTQGTPPPKRSAKLWAQSVEAGNGNGKPAREPGEDDF